VRDLVKQAARAFEEIGCAVEEVDPKWGDPTQMELCLFASTFAGMLGHLLDEWQDRMDPALVMMTREGMQYSAADYCRAQGERLAFYDRVHSFFKDYDLLLTPSLSVAAFPADRIIPAHWAQHPWDWLRWAGFSYPFNLTGSPAATCPCGFTAEGLPVGIQVVGRRHQDLQVLQACRAFEHARPWRSHRPALS
jgi:aspartyl-tRNA(Asn)/glutamyl-tRNA(Gln) amidotransferase subunit A